MFCIFPCIYCSVLCRFQLNFIEHHLSCSLFARQRYKERGARNLDKRALPGPNLLRDTPGRVPAHPTKTCSASVLEKS